MGESNQTKKGDFRKQNAQELWKLLWATFKPMLKITNEIHL